MIYQLKYVPNVVDLSLGGGNGQKTGLMSNIAVKNVEEI